MEGFHCIEKKKKKEVKNVGSFGKWRKTWRCNSNLKQVDVLFNLAISLIDIVSKLFRLQGQGCSEMNCCLFAGCYISSCFVYKIMTIVW